MEIYQAPLLKECMQTDYRANIARKALTAFWGCQIGSRLLSVHFYDGVAEVQIWDRVLVRKLAAEKLWQVLHLDLVDLVYIEPCTAAGNDERATGVSSHFLLQHHLLFQGLFICVIVGLGISWCFIIWEHFFRLRCIDHLQMWVIITFFGALLEGTSTALIVIILDVWGVLSLIKFIQGSFFVQAQTYNNLLLSLNSVHSMAADIIYPLLLSTSLIANNHLTLGFYYYYHKYNF